MLASRPSRLLLGALLALALPLRSALEIRTTALPPCDLRTAPYSAWVTAAGGSPPYAWVCGGLPAGVTCSGGGLLSGTPAAASGNYTVTVTVTDATAASAQASFPLAVYTAPAILTPALLPAGVSGLDYGGFAFHAAGTAGAEDWAMTAGTLPTGLYFNGGSSGFLSGTPAQTGTFNFTLTLTEGAASHSRAFTLQIGPRLVPPFWSRRGLAGGVLDVMMMSPAYAADRTIVGAEAGRGTLYLSRDGGYYWNRLPFTSPGGGVIGALAFPPGFDGRPGGDHTLLAGVAGYDGLLRSTDLGQTWTALPSATALGFTTIRQIFFDGATPGRVIVLAATGGFNSVIAASNDLLNWTALASGPFSGLMPSPDFATDRILFAAQSGGESSSLLRSTNGGSSFTTLQSGYAKAYGTLAISPRFATDRTLAFIDNGLSVSRDGGDSFARVGVPGIGGPLAFPSDFDAESRSWIFATTGGGGARQLALSTDLGLSFTPTGTTGMPPAAFSGNYRLSPTFAEDHTVIGLGFPGSAMYRSEDGGASWSPADGGLYLQVFNAVAFATDFPSTMFAGTDQGIYYSTNGGASWRRSAAGAGVQWPLQITGFAVSPVFASDRTLYAYAYDGINHRAFPLRSTDGGLSFSAPSGYFPMTPYTTRGQIAVSPNFATDQKVFFTAGLTGTSYFYVSYNRGATYIAQGPGFGGAVNVSSAFGMAVSPAYATDATIYLVNAYGAPRVLRSTDGGMLFYDGGASWPAYSWLTPVLAPDYDRNAAPAGTNKTLFAGCRVSTDDGASFADLPGLACGNVYPAPDYPTSGRALAVDGGNNYYNGGPRLHRHDGAPGTVTNGATWTELFAPGGAPFGGVQDVAYSPGYASDHTLALAAGDGLFLSTDHGASFTALTGADSFNAEVTAVAEDPNNPGRLFIGTQSQGAALSTDEGGSAIPLAGLPAGAVRDLLAAGSPTALLAATAGGVWRRTDFSPAGAWTLVLSGDFQRLRDDPGAGRILAVQSSGATRASTDAGASWSPFAAALADVRDIVRVPGGALSESEAPATTASLWAATAAGGAYYSTDNGTVWVAAPGGNDYTLPPGGGAGWKTVRPLGINPVSGAREVVLGHGTLGVYATRDGGQTWRRASGPGSGLEATSQNVTAFLASNTPWGTTDLLVGVAGAANGGVYLSADGGAHWTQVNQGFDPANLSIATLVKTACAGCPVQYYSGTYGGGLYTRTIALAPPPAFGANSACFGSTACACAGNAGSGPQQGGQAFRICGSGFQNGVAVEFDGVPAGGCVQNGGTVITCATTPPHVPGAAAIRVRNPDTRGAALPVGYAYLAGGARAGNSVRLARNGTGVNFTWNCPACTPVNPARLYRAQNAAMTAYLEVAAVGAGSSHTAADLLATPRSYFWSIE